MRVLLSTYGSRGDTEPMAGLAAALRARGAEAVLCAPPEAAFVDLAMRAGARFAPAFMAVRDWIRDRPRPSAPADFARLATEMMSAQFVALERAAEGCDAIVATGLMPSVAAARSLAERRGLRYEHVSFCPRYLPSHHHRPYAYPGQAPPPSTTDPRESWAHAAATLDTLFGGAINRVRDSIGLPPVAHVREHAFTARPWLATDTRLGPWQPTPLCDAVPTGAWRLRDERALPDGLLAFLQAGTPPVYAGFGSMGLQQARDTARVAIAAIRAQGRRAVIQRGWAGLALIDDRDDCCLVDEINQQALFGRVAAVIHHGGAGTTATAARAGVPQVIVPQVVDQPYWADRVAALGIGVAHDGAIASVDTLTPALERALSPVVARRARKVAAAMRDDGADTAARRLLDGS